MKLARVPRVDADTYAMGEQEVDGGPTLRGVRCAEAGCDGWAHGPDRWFGGVMDRATHIQVLREQLRMTCDRAGCPHPASGVLSSATPRKGR